MNFVKRLVLICSLCLSYYVVYADAIDSLYPELTGLEGIEKVDRLLEIADLVVPKIGLEIAKEAEKLSIVLGDKQGIKDAWRMFIVKNLEIGAIKEAEAHALNLIEVCKKENDVDWLFIAYSELSAVYSESNQFTKELNTIYDGLILATKLDNQYERVIGEFALADFYSHTLDNYVKAEELGLKCFDYFNQVKDTTQVYLVTAFLGKNALYQGEYTKAIAYTKGALTYSKLLQDYLNIRVLNGTLADIYIEIEDYEAALPYLKEAMNLSLIAEDPYEIANNKIAFAEIAFYRNQKDSAFQYLKEALVLINRSRLLFLKESAYELLYDIYKEEGDTKNMLLAETMLNEIVDSLNLIEVANELTQLELQKLALENEIKLQKLSQQNNTKIYFLLGLIGLSLLWFYYYQKKNQEKEKQRQFQLSEVLKDKERKELLLSKINQQQSVVQQQQTQLEEKLTLKAQELTSKNLLLSKKEEILSNVQKDIKSIRENATTPVKNKLISLHNLIERHKKHGNNWESFQLSFVQTHPNFFKNLLKHTPSLTNNDLRLAAYLKLNLNTTEIAEILGVAPESIHKAKYRLKKKLLLTKSDDLLQFLVQK